MKISSTNHKRVTSPAVASVNRPQPEQSSHFGDLPTDDYRKETRTTRVLFGDGNEPPYPNELALRKELEGYRNLFETDPAKDLDPSPTRYFDGERSVESVETGTEIAVLKKDGLVRELIRENGKLRSVKSREMRDGLIKDTNLRVGDWSAKRVETTFASRAVDSQRNFEALREGAVFAAEVAGSLVAIAGLALFIATNGFT